MPLLSLLKLPLMAINSPGQEPSRAMRYYFCVISPVTVWRRFTKPRSELLIGDVSGTVPAPPVEGKLNNSFRDEVVAHFMRERTKCTKILKPLFPL
jgi:hypothetical protein